MRPFQIVLFVAICATWGGCITPQNTRFPSPHFRPTSVERAAAQIYDPFPDRSIGPDTGFRPRDFNQQRSDVMRAKQRSHLSGLIPYGSSFPTGPVGMQYLPEAHYPNAVPY
ncbi:MAG: hypothetical protein R3C01_16660 [Planctomycetaceae bacterium]